MSSLRNSIVVVVAMMAIGFAGASRADFVYTTFTGDADCGISSSNTYTAAVDMGGPSGGRTVNGVTFEGTSRDYLYPCNLSGTNWEATDMYSCWTGAGGANLTGDVAGLFDDFRYDGDPMTVTFTNLSPGISYKTTFYSIGWGDVGTRYSTIATDDGGSIHFDQNYSGNKNGNLLMYDYIGPASGELTFTFDADSSATSHIYAFSNQMIPEPSALMLTTTGLIGLLAYAWRRRR